MSLIKEFLVTVHLLWATSDCFIVNLLSFSSILLQSKLSYTKINRFLFQLFTAIYFSGQFDKCLTTVTHQIQREEDVRNWATSLTTFGSGLSCMLYLPIQEIATMIKKYWLTSFFSGWTCCLNLSLAFDFLVLLVVSHISEDIGLPVAN